MLHPLRHQSLRHHYLSNVSQKTVNRIVNRALGRISQPQDILPPFLPLSRNEPNIYAPRFDLTKADIAYGRLDLPILMRDLHDTDKQTKYLAINSLADMFHDPEKLYIAVEIGIIDRLHHLIAYADVMVREAVLIALGVACNHYVGSKALIDSELKSRSNTKPYLFEYCSLEPVNSMYDDDHLRIPVGRLALSLADLFPVVRLKAAHVVNNTSKSWQGPEGLYKASFIPVLLERLKHEKCDKIKEEILLGLHGCLLYDQSEALSLNGMETLCNLLKCESSGIRAAAAACIADLSMHPYGKIQAIVFDIMKLLLPLLFSENRDELANAAGCVSFITMTTPSKFRALKLDIIDRLVFLAGDTHCLQLQLNAIKALTNISEAPKGRCILLNHYTEKITAIQCNNNEEVLERAKKVLLKVIRWKP